MSQQLLFRPEAPRAGRPDWQPTAPPSLSGVSRLSLDTETTGLRWWRGDRIVSMSGCLPDGTTFFIPTGHASGNIPEERVKDWLVQEVRGKQLDFFNAPFDMNMVRTTFGVDLEAQGCTFHDVGHSAALLNDHRYKSDLDDIANEYLGYGKLPDPGRQYMAMLHACDVDRYARHDSMLVHELRLKMWPMLDREELQAVRQLEDECIPATAEMMWNGAPVDEELLDEWLARSEREYIQALWDLYKDLGFKANPKSTDDMRAIFDYCKLPYPTNTMPGKDFGKVTFEKMYLERVKHPTIRKVRRVVRLANLRSKFLIPYKAEARKNGGLLRYALHQLRSGDEGGDSGTISGRYSSTGYKKLDEGINIQQVGGKKLDHSLKEETDWPYKLRKLFRAGQGLFLSADADQIEYRWFSHYAEPKNVMAAYAKDPKTNFHKITQKDIEAYIEITYERTKDCNFAGLYGAGLPKFAWMIGLDKAAAKPLYQAYHAAVPEIRQLMNRCIAIVEKRGFVRTILKRRARFPFKDEAYKALNRVIQGSAADENKVKIVALRKAKTGLKLRFTVHDEICGDAPDQACADRVSEVLNTQILKTKVPLLWSVNVGPNWQECKK